MKRFIEKELLTWKNEKERKPLILSGARQVGKSYVVEKNLASHFSNLITINFERQPEFKDCFSTDLDPKKILRRIEALSQRRVSAGETLLFLDEIQCCPKAITALRYFFEEIPEIHLIAAGSLLEFALEKASVPVGRVTYLYLTPLSFEEFLYNSKNELLLEHIRDHSMDKVFPQALHNKALEILKDYLAIGGMPQVVNHFIEHQDYLKSQQLLSDLLEAYIQDFPKYGVKDADLKYIDIVFARAAHLVGKPFKFVQISRDIQSKYLRKGLEHLVKAGVVNLVYKSSGVPLGANYNPERFKLLFLDVGLMQRACDFNIAQWITKSHDLINSGNIAEQFVGQQILSHSGFKQTKMYYWERDKRGSSAEIDYLLEKNGKLFPIEVKAGVSGRLKSMHMFLRQYPEFSYGVKVSMDNFQREGKIQSIPLYALGSWLNNE